MDHSGFQGPQATSKILNALLINTHIVHGMPQWSSLINTAALYAVGNPQIKRKNKKSPALLEAFMVPSHMTASSCLLWHRGKHCWLVSQRERQCDGNWPGAVKRELGLAYWVPLIFPWSFHAVIVVWRAMRGILWRSPSSGYSFWLADANATFRCTKRSWRDGL